MQTFRRIRRSIAVVLLMLYLPACTTWRPAKVSPEQLFASGKPKEVRVTTVEGQKLELTRPWITADSLHGYQIVRTPLRGDNAVTVRDTATVIALAGISRMEVRSTSATGIAAAILVASAVLAGIMAATCDPLCPGW